LDKLRLGYFDARIVAGMEIGDMVKCRSYDVSVQWCVAAYASFSRYLVPLADHVWKYALRPRYG